MYLTTLDPNAHAIFPLSLDLRCGTCPIEANVDQQGQDIYPDGALFATRNCGREGEGNQHLGCE